MTSSGSTGESPVADPDLGERTAAARREAKLTQKELAERLGTSLWSIDQLESGKRPDVPGGLAALARATGKRPSWFDAVEGQPGPTEQQPHEREESGSGRDESRLRARALGSEIRSWLSARRGRPGSRSRITTEEGGKSDPHAESVFGDRLAAARRDAGLTQKEIAERLGVSLSTIDRLERGQERIALPPQAIARATNKPETYFSAADRDAEKVSAPTDPESTRSRSFDRSGIAIILVAVTTLVVIRFFTEVVPVLPQALNFIDVPLVALLALAALVRSSLQANERRGAYLFLVPGFVFLIICAAATLANPSRVEAAPVLVFVYGFLAPIGVYLATYRLWPVGSALSLSRLLVWLGVLQLLVVGLIDLPRFIATDNPDEISGTFGENQYQLVFFLLVFGALLAGIFTFEHQRRVARAVPLLLVVTLGTVFLAQYRALLITAALTVCLIAALLGSTRLRGLLIGGLAAVAFVVTFSYTAEALPFLRLAPTAEALTSNPGAYASGRLEALDHVADLYNDNPRYIVTGTGPGTYSSRAWQTFALVEGSSASSADAGPYASSLLMGGDAYSTDVSDKYVRPRARYGEAIGGSYALTRPYSDYSSLLAEVGLLGFAVMLFIYLGGLFQAGRITLATRRLAGTQDPLPALALASTVAFFVLLQMGLLQSWFEVTRITLPTWMILAVVTKEFQRRFGEAQGIHPQPASSPSR